MKKIYYVDLAMCGGEELPEEFNLEDFCEVLQSKVPEVEIVPFTESMRGARSINKDHDLVSDAVFNEALGEYWPH